MAATEFLFRRALEAAHKALRVLKSDQVPAELRRVVRTPFPLPPPLAASLLRAIDEYPWLREKAQEAWPEIEAVGPGPEEASALLLRRPAGWTAQVTEAAAAFGSQEGRETLAGLQRQVAAGREKLAAAKEKARADKEKGEAEAARLRATIAERERALRRALETGGAGDNQRAPEEAARLAAELAGLAAERDALARDLRKARDRAAAQRRLLAVAEARVAESSRSGSWQGDPRSLAEVLDRTAAMARPPAQPPPEGEASRPTAAARLPARLRPDGKEAVAWLIKRTGAGTMIVDGYNLGFRLIGRRDPAPARERALMAASHLRRTARGPLRVVVVFDSQIEDALDEPWPGPVEVRFSGREGGADEEIAELACTVVGLRVVVSDDRAVREAGEHCGALALWSQAVAEWEGQR